MRWQKCQDAVRQWHLDGWLLTDFRRVNPIAAELVHLPHTATRRWFCLIPAEGEPRWLVPRLERSLFAEVPGTVTDYGSRQELLDGLRGLLQGVQRLAVDYSPKGELPTVSFLDAGTFELLQSFGVELVSSADLVHWVLGRVDEKGLALHRQAAQKLLRLKDEAFTFIVDALMAGRTVTEWDVQQFLLQRFQQEGLTTSHPPIVACMGNSANPHYFPTAEKAAPIGWGDFVLLDLFAKIADDPDAVYADITWCAYTGSTVPPRFEAPFAAVREARNAALQFLAERIEKGEPVHGFEVDAVARKVIAQHGFADRFIHRLGHSLGREVHGWGINLDGYETHDHRQLVPGTLVTIEPGIYGPEIGVRSEINVVVQDGKIEVTTLPLQERILPLI
jgi:Xaa-Pro dipeptidase